MPRAAPGPSPIPRVPTARVRWAQYGAFEAFSRNHVLARMRAVEKTLHLAFSRVALTQPDAAPPRWAESLFLDTGTAEVRNFSIRLLGCLGAGCPGARMHGGRLTWSRARPAPQNIATDRLSRHVNARDFFMDFATWALLCAELRWAPPR